jgi:putative ABC transport system substrate-binding protein
MSWLNEVEESGIGIMALHRRECMRLIGGAAAWPLAARAQQPDQMRRIGALIPGTESGPAQVWRIAFERGLQKLGWIDGRNVRIDYRWAAGDIDRYRAFATELVGLRPDVLFAGNTPALAALQQATRDIPIVFALVGNPIGDGFVTRLDRPGGNITGFMSVEPPLAGKCVDLLKDAIGNINRVAFLYNLDTAPYAQAFLPYAQAAAAKNGAELIAAPVQNDMKIERALAIVAGEPNDGLVVLASDFTTSHRERIISLAAKDRLPAIYTARVFVDDGGLISYSESFDEYGLAAGYVHRILRGEKPGDLPVQAPARFELRVNLKAAKTIGLTIPQTFLLLADEVIE